MARSAGKSFRTADQVAGAGAAPAGLGFAGRRRARELAEQAHRAIADAAASGAEATPGIGLPGRPTLGQDGAGGIDPGNRAPEACVRQDGRLSASLSS